MIELFQNKLNNIWRNALIFVFQFLRPIFDPFFQNWITMSRQTQLHLKFQPKAAAPPSRSAETASSSGSGSVSGLEFKHPKGFPFQRSRIASKPESGDDESTSNEFSRRTSTGKKPTGTMLPEFDSPPSSSLLYPTLIDTGALLNDISLVSSFAFNVCYSWSLVEIRKLLILFFKLYG